MEVMESFRKNLHLTRQEALMVFVLVVLLSGLMFSVGLWLGISMSSAHPEIAQLPTSSNHAGRKPSSVETSTEKKVEVAPRAGENLRKAFQESKQKALAEVMVEQSTSDVPKSILDSRAHQEEHSEWNRKPASVEPQVREEDSLGRLRDQEEARRKAGPPGKVSSLFERSPDAIKDFDPKPGTYTVQLASFATYDESVALVKDLRKAGFLDAYTQEISFKNGEKWHRVALGSYPNPVYARKMGERLRRRGLAKDFIVRKVAD